MKEPKNLMRAEIAFNTPKLKKIPGQNYQELSKLKILGLNALTINCTQSAIPCIAFCWQFLFAFSLQFKRLVYQRFPFRDLSCSRLSVRSTVDFCSLQASHPEMENFTANAVIAISFRIPRLVLNKFTYDANNVY